MKIGNYTDDEILEFMTEGEGRGFLGRSMYDAIMGEIERLNNRVKQLEKSIMISNKKHSFMTKDNIKLRTIINELEKDLEEKIDEDRLNILSNSHWKYVLNKLQELKEV